MKVKLLISRSGPSGTFGVGDVIDVGAEEGKRMIEKNQCVPVKAAPKKEKAVKSKAKREKASN